MLVFCDILAQQEFVGIVYFLADGDVALARVIKKTLPGGRVHPLKLYHRIFEYIGLLYPALVDLGNGFGRLKVGVLLTNVGQHLCKAQPGCRFEVLCLSIRGGAAD